MSDARDGRWKVEGVPEHVDVLARECSLVRFFRYPLW